MEINAENLVVVVRSAIETQADFSRRLTLVEDEIKASKQDRDAFRLELHSNTETTNRVEVNTKVIREAFEAAASFFRGVNWIVEKTRSIALPLLALAGGIAAAKAWLVSKGWWLQ